MPAYEFRQAKELLGHRDGHRIAMVIPYVGRRLPSWFRLFASSCAASAPLVDYLLFLSDAAALPADFDVNASRDGRGTGAPWCPPNVKLLPVGLDELARLHARMAPEADGGGDAAAHAGGALGARRARAVSLVKAALEHNSRYLVEFKPAIGHVFEDHLREYSHWAFGDLDVIMGDAAAWIDPFEMRAFDVFTLSFGDQFRA